MRWEKTKEMCSLDSFMKGVFSLYNSLFAEKVWVEYLCPGSFRGTRLAEILSLSYCLTVLTMFQLKLMYFHSWWDIHILPAALAQFRV